LAYGLAAVLATVVATAVFPKVSGDAVTLAGPIFDHSKVAMIDEMVRLGLPPGNPFFSEAGHEARLVYYYLWHFSAAELSLTFGFGGWTADVALTAFTALSILSLMMGFAVWIGGRASAAYFVVLLAFAASLHPILEFAVPPETLYGYLLPPTGFAGWLFQATWAPQHVASAGCVVLSAYLLMRLARQPSALVITVLGVVGAGGFESSTWVGGFVFGAAAPLIAVVLLIGCAPRDRLRFLVSCAVAGLIAMILTFPLLRDQAAASAARGDESPIAFQALEVFDGGVPEAWRRILDVPAYWLVLLVIEFPAIYLPGLFSLVGTLRTKLVSGDQIQTSRAFAALGLASLVIAGTVTITFAENNDLGWRGVLPGVLILTIFAATGLARWLATPNPWAAAAAMILLVLALPRSFQIASANINGAPSASDQVFAATPAMWQAVRKYTGPDERVANNPRFMEGMTPWAINISWALLANRRSCYAGPGFAAPFTTLSSERIDEIDGLFRRVFDGKVTADDIRDLATRYQCRVAVLTTEDAAWAHDPFADSAYYKLAEEKPQQWKIYRSIDALSR
jgi:MFS family permease